MSDRPTASEVHGQHADERNRVRALARHEVVIRDRERQRVLAHLGPLTEREDETGFAPGGKV